MRVTGASGNEDRSGLADSPAILPRMASSAILGATARGVPRKGRVVIANLIVDFFRNLGQQRIDGVVNTANAKKMGAIAKAKTEAAKKFNAASMPSFVG